MADKKKSGETPAPAPTAVDPYEQGFYGTPSDGPDDAAYALTSGPSSPSAADATPQNDATGDDA